ncbi:MAG: sulfatase-like hydrolase/transferase [Clostridiales bacterium]|nr:sulfatase-like hydrolase/transferase [Clostridiales bacterium]
MKVLFIDIDTLRPDHLGCYGYGRNTSPNIDSIADEGVCFDNYYCSDAPCLPSRAALITGQCGIRTGVVGHGGTAADMRPWGPEREFRDVRSMGSLFTQMRRAGLYTISFSSFPERHTAWWFNAGLNECHNCGGVGHESAEAVTPSVLEWLKSNGKKKDWFLHVHYWDPHGPYRTPEEFGNPFENTPLPDNWIDKERFQEHLQHVGPHGANEIYMWNDKADPNYPRYPGKLENLKDVKYFIDQYDCGISYADQHVGKILSLLKEMQLYDEELAVIVTSDHGENLGEFGIYGEHATADIATGRIPMIIKWPGGLKGIHDFELHSNIDLLPTLRELLDIENKPAMFKHMEIPEGHYDGSSYAKTIRTGEKAGKKGVIISQCAHVCQRSVRFDEYLYIRTYHGGYHLFEREMLFDVRKSTHELENIAEKCPELCEKAAKILLDWQDDMMKKSQYQIDPLWTVMKENGPYHIHGQLDAYIKRLENTPRKSNIEELKKRYSTML